MEMDLFWFCQDLPLERILFWASHMFQSSLIPRYQHHVAWDPTQTISRSAPSESTSSPDKGPGTGSVVPPVTWQEERITKTKGHGSPHLHGVACPGTAVVWHLIAHIGGAHMCGGSQRTSTPFQQPFNHLQSIMP